MPPRSVGPKGPQSTVGYYEFVRLGQCSGMTPEGRHSLSRVGRYELDVDPVVIQPPLAFLNEIVTVIVPVGVLKWHDQAVVPD